MCLCACALRSTRPGSSSVPSTALIRSTGRGPRSRAGYGGLELWRGRIFGSEGVLLVAGLIGICALLAGECMHAYASTHHDALMVVGHSLARSASECRALPHGR